jgi:hypothetical protein
MQNVDGDVRDANKVEDNFSAGKSPSPFRKIRRVSWRACILWLLIVAIVVGVLIRVFGNWPVVLNLDGLVQVSGEWLVACNEAHANGAKHPPTPPRIAALEVPYTNYGGTWARGDKVLIFVSTRHRGSMTARNERFTNYYYEIYPLDLDKPNYQPRPKGEQYKATRHPRVFKTWETFRWDDTSSGYVEVPDP